MLISAHLSKVMLAKKMNVKKKQDGIQLIYFALRQAGDVKKIFHNYVHENEVNE